MYKEIKFDKFTWVDLTSPTKEEFKKVSEVHKLDYLLVSDSLEPGHLPKIEMHDDITFMLFRANDKSLPVKLKKQKGGLSMQDMTSKIAIFIKDDVLITAHRIQLPFLNIGVTQDGSGYDVSKSTVVNKVGVEMDTLIFSILSHVIKSYAEPANILSKEIDEIEQKIFLKNLKKVSLERLYLLKTEARICKKLLIFTQQALNLYNEVPEEFEPQFQDIKESLIKVLLEYEEVLEDSNNLMNTYISVNSNHANDIMKVLTVFSAFFLPLTFIAGIYGMNFENMPELKQPWGYPALLGVMFTVTIIILIWFKRKKIM